MQSVSGVSLPTWPIRSRTVEEYFCFTLVGYSDPHLHRLESLKPSWPMGMPFTTFQILPILIKRIVHIPITKKYKLSDRWGLINQLNNCGVKERTVVSTNEFQRLLSPSKILPPHKRPSVVCHLSESQVRTLTINLSCYRAIILSWRFKRLKTVRIYILVLRIRRWISLI